MKFYGPFDTEAQTRLSLYFLLLTKINVVGTILLQTNKIAFCLGKKKGFCGVFVKKQRPVSESGEKLSVKFFTFSKTIKMGCLGLGWGCQESKLFCATAVPEGLFNTVFSLQTDHMSTSKISCSSGVRKEIRPLPLTPPPYIQIFAVFLVPLPHFASAISQYHSVEF